MRRKIKISRETTPDPRFSSAMVSQFINYMTLEKRDENPGYITLDNP